MTYKNAIDFKKYSEINIAPIIQFDADMKVHLMPAFMGSLQRMVINGCFIILSIDYKLTPEENPVWSVYDTNKNVYRFHMTDVEGMLNKVREYKTPLTVTPKIG